MNKDNIVPTDVPVIPVGEQQERQITLNNMQDYNDAISKFRKQIEDAVNQGIMSQQAAAKIILDQEYGFFQQIVTIEYK
jgi:hypothetical protein